MSFHDIVYSLELGQGKVWMNRGLIFLLIAVLSTWYMVSEFHGFKEKEAMDAAQVGRQIAEGKGFTTEWIRPQAITLFKEKLTAKTDSENRLEKFPEIYQSPLYPYCLGFLFKITGKPYVVKLSDLRESPFRAEWVICFFNLLCTYATGIVIFILGARIFDGRVGFLSSVVFLFSDLIWRFALSGLSTSLVLLLLTVSWFFLNEAFANEENEGGGLTILWLALAGFFAGLSVLTRLSLVWLMIPMLLILLAAFRTKVWIVSFYFLTLFLTFIPFLIRNHSLTGNWLGGWGINYSPTDLAFSLLQGDEATLPLKMIPIRMVQATGYHLQNFQGLLGGSFAALLSFAALFHVFRRERSRCLQYGIFILLPFLILAGSLVNAYPDWCSIWNMGVMVLPLMTICGSAYFYVLLDRMELEYPVLQKSILVGFVLLNAAPFLLTLAPPGEMPFHFPPYYPPMIKLSAEWNQKNEVMVSDMPWATAWYGDRVSIWLPAKIKDLYWIHDYIQPISSMLLTPITFDQKISDLKSPGLVDYEKIITRVGIPANFPLPAVVALPPKNASGQEAFIYLSDRPRWQEEKH
ncbi:MAG: glycosyltransferase family 39 protein [Verrucomicrobiota bacterium]